MPNELTPELRFPEFENEWEEKRLGKLFSNSKTKGNDSIPIYSVSQDKGLVPRESLDRNIQKDAESGDNLKVQPNDLVYNTMRMWQGAVGFAVEECMVSPAYVVLSPQKKVDPQFFLYFFERLRTRHLFTIHSHGLTLDRLRLYYKDFSGIKVKVPSYVEQKKITNFLTAVDEKIKTLTKKKTLLEEYKKGVMQRLFSQEIRFKDEQGQDFPDWEEKTLDQVVRLKKGKYDARQEKTNYKCIELEHLESESGRLLGYVDSINAGSIKNKFKRGDVLFGKLRPYLNKYCFPDFDGVCSSEIWVMKAIDMSNRFLYYLINTSKFIELANMSSGSKMPRADWKVVSQGEFLIPSLPEQQKIANFLTALDEKINKASQQIETAQAFKKGLLQKMFV